MDKEEALKIIRMIAEGEDPYLDEKPAKYLPEHNPKTLKAICKAIASLFPTDNEAKDTTFREPMVVGKFINKPIEQFFKNFEKDAIIDALKKDPFHKNEAAEILQISYDELLNKINEHEIDISKIEQEVISKALLETEWNKSKAAELLGVALDKLELKINELGLDQKIVAEFLLVAIKSDYSKNIKIGVDNLLKTIEKNAIISALKKSNYSQNQSADILKISFRSLRYRIEKLSIDIFSQSFHKDIYIETDFFKYPIDLSLDEFLEKVEKKLIKIALKETNYHKNLTAEKLGISFRSLRYRIDNLGIKKA